MNASILGIHHVTAIASDPQKNLDFYTRFLGLRLVKKTVNFDDPATYHFYFGDEVGHPGTLITFFPWVGARRGRSGTGEVATTSFAVPKGAFPHWIEKAKAVGLAAEEGGERFGQQVLRLFDTDGLELELIASEEGEGHAITRIHSATLAEEGYERTAGMLTGTLGFRLTAEQGNRFRYEIGEGGSGATLDVVCMPDAQRALGGAGSVHHIAFRTPDDEQQKVWHSKLVQMHYNVSPVMDRQYFHSIYFREPGGVLFEIATDPPGFTVDEPLEKLGTSLKLPPVYESARERIESVLPVLV